jgi:hypothetical protein
MFASCNIGDRGEPTAANREGPHSTDAAVAALNLRPFLPLLASAVVRPRRRGSGVADPDDRLGPESQAMAMTGTEGGRISLGTTLGPTSGGLRRFRETN